jgi:hypothetical protein
VVVGNFLRIGSPVLLNGFSYNFEKIQDSVINRGFLIHHFKSPVEVGGGLGFRNLAAGSGAAPTSWVSP